LTPVRRPAVFLDRDGTLHRELAHAPRDAREIELFPAAPHALASLTRAGFALIVVTNQSAIARGDVGFDELRRVNAHLARVLSEDGARVEAFYVCPHHPREGHAPYRRACACRKPRPALLERAAADLELDLTRSWIVGDALRDMDAGLAAGASAVLVETGKGAKERTSMSSEQIARVRVVRDIGEAAVTILRHTR
jgi:D-glycero-D-manno-heptose 1,7-bisphosphate phosphatase